MTPSHRFSFSLVTLALLGALSAAPALASPTVSIGGPANVAPGASFQLGVSASGFGDLYAYQLDVGFDPTLFKATGVSQGGFLSTAGLTFFDGGSIDNAAGVVSFILETVIGPGAGASGGGELFQVGFQAIGPANTAGNFSISNVGAFDSSLAAIGMASVGSAVAIPEPSALALALLAMGALVTTRAGVKANPKQTPRTARNLASAA